MTRHRKKFGHICSALARDAFFSAVLVLVLRLQPLTQCLLIFIVRSLSILLISKSSEHCRTLADRRTVSSPCVRESPSVVDAVEHYPDHLNASAAKHIEEAMHALDGPTDRESHLTAKSCAFAFGTQ